jgi:hypothetical protein
MSRFSTGSSGHPLIALAAALLLCGGSPAAARGAVDATLHASFSPERLGASTTIGFGFRLRASTGGAPAPLVHVDLRMPAGLNLTRTTLGLGICSPSRLASIGGKACPGNSRLGSGSAFVEVPFGKGSGRELPAIQAFMGPPKHGNMVILFYVTGRAPVFANLIFTGELLPATGLFATHLSTSIPPIASVADGPDVSIVRVSASIGPKHLLYHRYVHGRLRAFHPRGVALPRHCPRGGFPFSAEFTFLDGSHARASTSVPCPKRSPRLG